MLKRSDQVVVVTPNSNWNWIPSNIWVGVGKMKTDQVTFKLGPIYQRKGIEFHQALATAIHPEGGGVHIKPFVDLTYTDPTRAGEQGELEYDYLINATGPKLNFGATPGLGPEGFSYSVCTSGHAVEASAALQASIARMKKGERQVLVVGMGHGTCTCEGAAFEYAFNVEHEVRQAGVRDVADIVYLTNEYDLGDFGVGGLTFTQQGFQTTSKLWTESLFRERGIRAITGAHVTGVEEGVVHYEQLDGSISSLSFDFAMLLPPFRGVDLKAFDAEGSDISDELFAPSGFMKVDADYGAKPFEEWRAEDWPSTYQVPRFPNISAVGIAFAPPHQISQPRKTPNGTVIAPSPPRTGMPSGIMGKLAATNIAEMIKHGPSPGCARPRWRTWGRRASPRPGPGCDKGARHP
jgi:sulfide:quinone oxidoreductase